MEVGIGISAASLATLRPLVQKFFPNLLPDNATAQHGSNLKWSSKIQKRTNKKSGYLRSAEEGSLNNTTVTTTVVGARPLSDILDNGSQENIFSNQGDNKDICLKTWDPNPHGINKSVQVTTVEEHNASRSSASDEERGDGSDDMTVVYERV